MWPLGRFRGGGIGLGDPRRLLRRIEGVGQRDGAEVLHVPILGDFGIDVELSDRAEEIDWGEVVSGRAAVDYGQRAVFFLISTVTVLVLTAYSPGAS